MIKAKCVSLSFWVKSTFILSYLYDLGWPIEDQLRCLAGELYRAGKVLIEEKARRKLQFYAKRLDINGIS